MRGFHNMCTNLNVLFNSISIILEVASCISHSFIIDLSNVSEM